LYIHGGHDIREGSLDTLWKIDMSVDEYDWVLLQTRGAKKPGNIAYHTLNMYSDHECILIGGSSLGSDNPNIYELDLNSLEWTVDKHAKPEDLKSIDEHTATLHDGKIYVFGGNIHGFKTNNMYILDIETRKWQTMHFKNGPPPRASHSAIVKDDELYIFGGKDEDNNKLGDLWIYNIKTGTWNEAQYPHGEGPISRSGHSTGVFKNYIIVYAGIHELTQELSDMYLYDTNNGTWITLFEEEHSPVHHNRSNHSSFSSGKLS
jgi:N-acetylneuraminic acid mutarotase